MGYLTPGWRILPYSISISKIPGSKTLALYFPLSLSNSAINLGPFTTLSLTYTLLTRRVRGNRVSAHSQNVSKIFSRPREMFLSI